VALNRAIAVAEADGVEAGRAIVERLDLDDCRSLHSTRSELLRRLGRPPGRSATIAPGEEERPDDDDVRGA
jgi:predicted RNA polymerase sigma factor